MFYCRIDLSTRDSHICVLDENLSILLQRKVTNELHLITALLDPFNPDLQIRVESTFNWYWLVDGLQNRGLQVSLAHSLALALITQAKVKTVRPDAFTLAKLLRAGLIPKAYVYPRSTRPLRDLLPQRLKLVCLRAHDYGSLRQLELMRGGLSSSPNQIKLADEQDLNNWSAHRLAVMTASHQLERIDPLSKQIADLQQQFLDLTRDNADYRRLMRIPAIGKILALRIL